MHEQLLLQIKKGDIKSLARAISLSRMSNKVIMICFARFPTIVRQRSLV
jgi:hypothetical protein